MKKIIFFTILILAVIGSFSFIDLNSVLILDSRKLDGNNISTWYRNNGSFNRDPLTGVAGFEWPKGSIKFARFASGIWIGAKVGNDTLVTVAEYSSEYLPGYIDNNGNPQGKDDLLFKVYRIEEGDTSSLDYQNWPVNQGAYLNTTGKPLLLGKQTMFYSFTDGYPESHTNTAGRTAPLKAQIIQTNWCYDLPNHLYNIIFTECRIINRHGQTWENAYIGIWTDDDIGDATNDASGCDSILNLTFAYNFTSTDGIYGNQPPATGFLILQGLQKYTGNNLDTAYIFRPTGLFVNKKVGYSGIELSSFNYFLSGDPNIGEPRNYRESYRGLQGFNRNGNWINPITNKVTYFPFSGDPETGNGWIVNVGMDVRSLSSLGPVTVQPNDTQYLIFAQIIARGNSRLNSVTKLKEAAVIAKRIYDNNFTNVVSVNDPNEILPERFALHQNFPNPFNPVTVISYSLNVNSEVQLKIYDVNGREVAILVNQKQSAGNYSYEFDASKYNLTSGVYFYTLKTKNHFQSRKMVLLK